MPGIVSIQQRPDLATWVARQRHDTFPDAFGDMTVEQLTELILHPSKGPNATFVLFEDDRPIATAGLAHSDLESRPDLTPWLVGVLVLPAARHRGHATTLVRRVEQAATEAGVSTLWLYSSKAAGLYDKLGWHRVGMEHDHGRDVVLMRRGLPTSIGSPAPP